MDLTDDQQREIASVVPGANLAGKWGWDDRTKRAHELVARLIREAKDEAWDEGWDACAIYLIRQARAAVWDEGYGSDLECNTPRINPYRD